MSMRIVRLRWCRDPITPCLHPPCLSTMSKQEWSFTGRCRISWHLFYTPCGLFAISNQVESSSAGPCPTDPFAVPTALHRSRFAGGVSPRPPSPEVYCHVSDRTNPDQKRTSHLPTLRTFLLIPPLPLQIPQPPQSRPPSLALNRLQQLRDLLLLARMRHEPAGREKRLDRVHHAARVRVRAGDAADLAGVPEGGACWGCCC
jgi:hypothetical protein